jgi:hypothetical protein
LPDHAASCSFSDNVRVSTFTRILAVPRGVPGANSAFAVMLTSRRRKPRLAGIGAEDIDAARFALVSDDEVFFRKIRHRVITSISMIPGSSAVN